VKAKDIDEVRRQAWEAGCEAGRRTRERVAHYSRLAGQRAFRERATNPLAAAGYPPEVFGIVAALEIEGDGP